MTQKKIFLLVGAAGLWAVVRLALARSRARAIASAQKFRDATPGNGVQRVEDVDGNGAAGLSRTVHTLQRAFFTDPVFTFLVSDGERRWNFTKAFFELLLRSRPFRVFSAGDDREAILFFIRCDHGVAEVDEDVSTLEFIMNGGYKLLVYFRFLYMTRVLSFFDGQEHHRVEIMKQQHHTGKYYYILQVGVDPVAQGKGLGSKLLQYLCAQADENNMPIYLESSSEGSRRLYERHGFVLRDTVYPPRDDQEGEVPPIYLMSRPVSNRVN